MTATTCSMADRATTSCSAATAATCCSATTARTCSWATPATTPCSAATVATCWRAALGDDTLFGGAGDDMLDGGPGHDRLAGDAGADRFILAGFDGDEILDLNLGDGDVVDFSALAHQALGAGLSLAEAVRLEAGPFGTTLLVDVGDGSGFHEAALLRGVEPVAAVTSNGELVALARPDAVPRSRCPSPTSTAATASASSAAIPCDRSGSSVSGAGDVNGDGFADVIVGAPDADLGDPRQPGRELRGVRRSERLRRGARPRQPRRRQRLPPRPAAIHPSDYYLGASVSGAGDVNGDGFADLIVGAALGSLAGRRELCVFGKPAGFGGALDLASLDGSNGFRLAGIDGPLGYDYAGRSVSAAGDVNGDGFADLIVGHLRRSGRPLQLPARATWCSARPPASWRARPGDLDGSNGFRLSGSRGGRFRAG